MANKFENIRKALMTPMSGLLPGVDIAWPNDEYKPVVGTPYAKLFLLPNQPSSVTNGQDGYDVHKRWTIIHENDYVSELRWEEGNEVVTHVSLLKEGLLWRGFVNRAEKPEAT